MLVARDPRWQTLVFLPSGQPYFAKLVPRTRSCKSAKTQILDRQRQILRKCREHRLGQTANTHALTQESKNKSSHSTSGAASITKSELERSSSFVVPLNREYTCEDTYNNQRLAHQAYEHTHKQTPTREKEKRLDDTRSSSTLVFWQSPHSIVSSWAHEIERHPPILYIGMLAYSGLQRLQTMLPC